jgi:hypothetical protein
VFSLIGSFYCKTIKHQYATKGAGEMLDEPLLISAFAIGQPVSLYTKDLT